MPLLSDAHVPPLLSATGLPVTEVVVVRRLLARHVAEHGWERRDAVDVEDMLGL